MLELNNQTTKQLNNQPPKQPTAIALTETINYLCGLIFRGLSKLKS